MFVGFNLKLTEDEIKFVDSRAFGDRKNFWTRQNDFVGRELEKYVSNNNSLSASEIERDWFPSVEANVFISHSHKDLYLASALAAYLESKYGIKPFIDSTVWGNANELLKNIDDKYSRQIDGSYIYEKVRNSSSHVHMLLNSALMKMMDKAESVIFLNTPNSIVFRDGNNNYTESPWLYSELLMSRLLQKRQLKEYRVQSFGGNYRFDSLRINYNVTTDHLYDLNFSDLISMGGVGYQALDKLYRSKGIIK